MSDALESVNDIPGRKSKGLFTFDDFVEALGVLRCRNKQSIEECGIFLIGRQRLLLFLLERGVGEVNLVKQLPVYQTEVLFTSRFFFKKAFQGGEEQIIPQMEFASLYPGGRVTWQEEAELRELWVLVQQCDLGQVT